MKLLSLLFGILLFIVTPMRTLGQTEIEPLRVVAQQFDTKRATELNKIKRDYLQKTTQSDTIPLPFFDDFSRTDLSWAPSHFKFGLSINRLQFFSERNGRGFGAKQLVVKTTNRGGNWDPTGNLGEADILSVSFFSGGNGWACGTKGFLAQTADSGNTWTTINSPANTITLVDIAFKNAQNGILADSLGKIYLTNNGGINWTVVDQPEINKIKVGCVAWNQDGNPVVGGDSSRMALSTNNGGTWIVTTNALQPGKSFRRVKFFGTKTGFAIGDSGLLYKTFNSGLNWMATNSKSKGFLTDLDFAYSINTRLGWAVGKDGIILATQDGGDSWLQIRSGTAEDIQSVAMITEYRGWMSTHAGALIQVVIDPSRPDSKWWERNSGVYINNFYCFNPITVGVATFDGTNDAGLPYTNEINRYGGCDTLASTHLDLSGNNPFLNLTFYFQPGGKILQLRPGPGDSLVVQFKSRHNNWISMWRRTGPPTPINNPFRFASILVPDSMKYDGFQFRFINYGTRNGNNEIWNLDYVRLDNQHYEADSSSFDLAITQNPARLLKEFHAYPLDQFNELAAGGSLLADEVVSEAINLNAVGTNNITGKFRISQEKRTGLVLIHESPNSSISGMGLIDARNSRKEIKIPRQEWQPLGPFTEPSTLRYGFILDSDPNFNIFNNNDTVYSKLNLSSYMAYDDGSAEAAKKVLGTNSKAAVKFFLPRTDTLTDIALYFPRSPYTQTQDITFTLILYRDIDVENNMEYPIFRFPVTLPAAGDSLNRFDVFSLRIRPLQQRILEGGKHFFIGWQNTVIDNGNEVALGIDINSSSPGNFYFTQSGEWKIDNSDDFPIMIRPVFGEETPTAVREKIGEPISPFFPNPAKKTIHNSAPFQNLKIISVLGQLCLDFPNREGQQDLDLELAPGLYIIHWQEKDGRPVSQKLMIQQ